MGHIYHLSSLVELLLFITVDLYFAVSLLSIVAMLNAIVEL